MGMDSVQEYIALEEKDAVIRDFLDRHNLDARDWYNLIERGYLKAATMLDPEDPVFPRYAYWLMRHELYCNHRKESGMSKKINYPNFRWSAERKCTLAEMHYDGIPVPEIAAHFGVSEDVIHQAFSKFNLSQRKSNKPVPQNSELEELKKQLQDIPVSIQLASVPAITFPMEELLSVIQECAQHNNAAMEAVFENKGRPACSELGQQRTKLETAIRMLSNMADVPPTP